ncbi:13495_t:CDS:2, partial [Acaulospora morrowiae]
VLGIAFLAGSWPTHKRLQEHSFHNKDSSQGAIFRLKDSSFQAKLFVNTSSSILALAVLALVTPAAFKIASTPLGGAGVDAQSIECNLQNISHATAIILMLVYIGLLFFQLKTHVKEVIDAKEYKCEEPAYPWYFDLFLIAISIAGISFCARYLVDSIEVLGEEYQLGSGFIGIVLFPLCVVSSFIEHYTAIKDAYYDRVDTAVSLIMNTSVQMALLVTPILVIVGWFMGHPLTLDFNVLEISVLACAVLIVNYLVADNEANWLEGYMLIISYILIAITFFYFPTPIEAEKEQFHCSIWSRNLNDSLSSHHG